MKKALTLADLLITIGIVGVIAALTFPVIKAEIVAKQLRTNFLKSYSTLNQVAKFLTANNESIVWTNYVEYFTYQSAAPDSFTENIKIN